MRLTHGAAVGLMVAVTLMWGTAGVVTRHLAQAHSFEITFWRSLFTMLALLVILPLWRGRAVFSLLRRGGRSLWISGVCWAVMFTAFMVALTLTSTASVLVTMSLGPLFTALAARLFIGHRLPARTWSAIVVAGLGIGWMYGTQLLGGGGGCSSARWWRCACRWPARRNGPWSSMRTPRGRMSTWCPRC